MWIDATVAAPSAPNPNDVAGPTSSASRRRRTTVWASAAPVPCSPAVPASTEQADAATKFIARATSEDCTTLVAKRKGWANVPPGTRASRYENQTYLNAAPFAETILASVQAADPQNPTVDRAPCAGVRFVAIPEFQGSGAAVEQMFSAALAGSMTGDEALATAQAPSTHEMRKGGCID
jgi:sorbitol/mannitol transport system substrate-binding protein